MNSMRTTLLGAFLGLALMAAGCVGTAKEKATDQDQPDTKDRIEAQYSRPVNQVYQAVLDVIRSNGTVVNETVLNGQTNAVNTVGRMIEGKVKESTVWIRVQQVDPQVTSVVVQTRAAAGGSDIDLAAMIDKQIDLKLRR
jgi:hypothetical protein